MTPKEAQLLYLTTTGHRSGKPREIDIWFTRCKDRYYVISYLFNRAQWIKNILQHPKVSFQVGEKKYLGQARILDPEQDRNLCVTVKRLSEQKYDWSDGLVVQLSPDRSLSSTR